MRVLFALALLFLASCHSGERVPVPRNDRFRFTREEHPFRGRVRSVVQTAWKGNSPDPAKDNAHWSSQDTYAFDTDGRLKEWVSNDVSGPDLEYSNDGAGTAITHFIWQKSTKKEVESWNREGAGYIVRVQEEVDGKTRSNTRRYDSTLLLLSEEGTNWSGEYQSFVYTYQNGRRTEVAGAFRQRYSYGPATDTDFQYRDGRWTIGRIVTYNPQDDPSRHQFIAPFAFEVQFTYQYDARGNWVYRRATRSDIPEVTVTKREITYY